MNATSRNAILHAYWLGYRVMHSGALLNPTGRKLRPTPSSAGYPSFRVEDPTGSKKQRTILLHVFAAYCWFGMTALDAECVRHKDDVRSNCVLENLVLGTRKENEADKGKDVHLRVGRIMNRARHARTAPGRAVRDARVRHLAREGLTHREIAERTHMTRPNVSRILRYRST